MRIRAMCWLALAAGLAGCATPATDAKVARQAARVQTGQRIIDMQLNTPPPPGAGLSGPEAQAIWQRHLADLAKPAAGRPARPAGALPGGGM